MSTGTVSSSETSGNSSLHEVCDVGVAAANDLDGRESSQKPLPPNSGLRPEENTQQQKGNTQRPVTTATAKSCRIHQSDHRSGGTSAEQNPIMHERRERQQAQREERKRPLKLPPSRHRYCTVTADLRPHPRTDFTYYEPDTHCTICNWFLTEEANELLSKMKGHEFPLQNVQTSCPHNKVVARKIYRAERLIGRGGFSQVYEVIEMCTNQRYAVKVLQKRNFQNRLKMNKLRREIEIQRYLNHPNIMRIYDVFCDDLFFYMVMELCSNRTLYNIMTSPIQICLGDLRFIMRAIANAIVHLKEKQVIHRDLKLANVLISEDLQPMIADFGLACAFLPNEIEKYTLCGTPNYIAPEILAASYSHGRGYSYAVDVWAMGVVLYMLLVRTPPFKADSVNATYGRIRSNDLQMPSYIAGPARDVIRRLLEPNPNIRMAIPAFLAHPFMRDSPLVVLPQSFYHKYLTSSPHPQSGSHQTSTRTTPVSQSSFNYPSISRSQRPPQHSGGYGNYRSLEAMNYNSPHQGSAPGISPDDGGTSKAKSPLFVSLQTPLTGGGLTPQGDSPQCNEREGYQKFNESGSRSSNQLSSSHPSSPVIDILNARGAFSEEVGLLSRTLSRASPAISNQDQMHLLQFPLGYSLSHFIPLSPEGMESIRQKTNFNQPRPDSHEQEKWILNNSYDQRTLNTMEPPPSLALLYTYMHRMWRKARLPSVRQQEQAISDQRMTHQQEQPAPKRPKTTPGHVVSNADVSPGHQQIVSEDSPTWSPSVGIASIQVVSSDPNREKTSPTEVRYRDVEEQPELSAGKTGKASDNESNQRFSIKSKSSEDLTPDDSKKNRKR